MIDLHKEFVISFVNISEVKCAHLDDFSKFSHIIIFTSNSVAYPTY